MKKNLMLFLTAAAMGFGANWLYSKYGVKLSNKAISMIQG